MPDLPSIEEVIRYAFLALIFVGWIIVKNKMIDENRQS